MSSKWIPGNKSSDQAVTDEFAVFIADHIRLRLDVFILEIARPIKTIQSAAELLKYTLLTICYKPEHASDPWKGIESLAWNVTCGDIPLFLQVFADFYPKNHPRHCPIANCCYILFQPDYAFSRRGINSRKSNRIEIANQVQSRFAKSGMSYDVEANLGTAKASRYVKPLSLSEPPIRWWDVALSDFDCEP